MGNLAKVTDTKTEHFTYKDYLTWDGDDRYEIINGKAYMMAPAPLVRHQDTAGKIYRLIADYLEDKPCKVFVSPIDVRLDPDGLDDTVVQPDIVVVCDKDKVDEKGINGVPDFVCEVLSPSSIGYDLITKLNKYLDAGVREYWAVDPDEKIVQSHLFEGKAFNTKIYKCGEKAYIRIFDDFSVEVEDLFPELFA